MFTVQSLVFDVASQKIVPLCAHVVSIYAYLIQLSSFYFVLYMWIT